MATLAGFTFAAPEQETAHVRVTASFDKYAADYYPFRDLDGALDAGAAARAVNLPVSMQANAQAGALAGGFGPDDWYERIHLRPGVITLGNLVSAQVRTVEVWNAHLTPQRLASLTPANDDGLTLTQPVPAPTTFGALESRLYTLSISLDGPPTIDARYTFTFPAQSPVLAVTGARVIGLMFRPNWREPLVERLLWLTDIITHRDGTEQRIGLRGTPRREWEYAVAAQGPAAARLEALVYGWAARVFAAPVWTDPQFLPTALPAGSTSITATTQHRDFAADTLAALVADDLRFELVEIASVTLGAPGAIALKRPTQADWPAGTRLFPARLVRIADAVRVGRPNPQTAEATLRLTVEPLQPLGDNPGPAPAQYLGQDVYLTRPNWSGGLDVEIARELAELIDADTGPVAVDDPARAASVVRSHRWTLKGRASIAAFRAWLIARAGRRVPAWLPSHARDLELEATAGASATTLVVTDIHYRAQYAQVPGRRDLLIRLPSGATALRRIVGADQVVAGQERIQIDAGPGETIGAGAWISFLGLHRLDGDRVELRWHTPEVLDCTLNVRLLPE